MNSQTLGWTLIHTMWQAPLIYLCMVLANKLPGSDRSAARYGVGVSALALVVLAAFTTYFWLSALPNGSANAASFTFFSATVATSQEAVAALPTFQQILRWIDLQLVWVLRFWVVGFVFYSFRLISGLWYVNTLKQRAVSIGNEWQQLADRLAEKLRISRAVILAEAKIASPMVVGYLKPVILFPVGLAAGLSTRQVETILLHELSHIRRHDYLVNIFQVIAEALLFFNPFVWLISSEIRREREHCCDDMVIGNGIDPLSYAKTLAHLEASSGTQLALGMAGDQNQLLNRIKRIMEKSAKKDWSNNRLLPVSLVVLGLVLASWLSIDSSAHRTIGHDITPVITPDTTAPAKSDKKLRHKKESPEAAKPGTETDEGADFTFRARGGEFDAFEEAFNERFKSEFGDFYKEHREQIDQMLKELRAERDAFRMAVPPGVYHFDELQHAPFATPIPDGLGNIFVDPADMMDAMGPLADIDVPVPPMEELSMKMDEWHLPALAPGFNEDAFREQERQWEKSREMLDEMLAKERWALDENLRSMESSMKEYEQAVHDMLIEDGYLTKDSKWSGFTVDVSNDEITVNGIKIKKQHKERYKALHDKFFRKADPHWIRRTE